MTATSRRGPLVQRLLQRYCDANGLTLTLDETLGHAGYIENPAGHRSFFVGTRFDLNPQGACEIARDKAYALEFLKRDGFPVPESLLIASQASRDMLAKTRPDYTATLSGAETAQAFAGRTGFPLFAKPNDGQEGRDVFRISDENRLKDVLGDLFTRHDKVLLQEAVAGQDLRILVLDGSILCAVERTPPVITGDGRSSFQELIEQTGLTASGQVRTTLEDQGVCLSDIAPPGETFQILPAANLSAGGTARMLTEDLPASLAKAAIASGKALGLRYFGVDLLVDRLSGTEPIYKILELNAAPGLAELHRQGPDEARLVEDIYQKVFEALRQMLSAHTSAAR
jgi:glutathione synthase/RimK-type ligase-like ATP-grasp enzyme